MTYNLTRLTKQTPRLTKFINKHIKNNPPLGVYLLQENTQNIGHILLIKDDQHVGKETQLPGPWIAGVLIHKKYRNRGLGLLMIRMLEKVLKEYNIPRINLFTNNPIAEKLYLRAGFKQTPLDIIRHKKEYHVFSKIINRQKKAL